MGLDTQQLSGEKVKGGYMFILSFNNEIYKMGLAKQDLDFKQLYDDYLLFYNNYDSDTPKTDRLFEWLTFAKWLSYKGFVQWLILDRSDGVVNINYVS